jgi:hypothetical protein
VASDEKEDSAPSKRKVPTTDAADEPASLEDAQASGKAANGSTSASGEVKKVKEAASAGKEEAEARPAKKAKTGAKRDEAKDEDGDEFEKEGESAEDPIEVDTPEPDNVATPAEPSSAKRSGVAKATSGNGDSKKEDETIPGDEAHLDHPENWATG